MRNYNDLPPKGKFIRTCIAFPILMAIMIVFYIFLNKHFILGGGFIIKYVIAFVLSMIVGTAQLFTTYRAWKKDEDNYY